MWEHIKCCKVLWKFIIHNCHLLSAPMSLKVVTSLSPLWFNILMKEILAYSRRQTAMQTGHYTESSVQELAWKSWGFLENQNKRNVSGNPKCSGWGMQIHRPSEVVIGYNDLKTHISTWHLLVHPLRPLDDTEGQILHFK